MDKYVINGGTRLLGRVKVSGAKNAAVAILPAVIVSDEPCVIENLPMVSDVAVIIEILNALGVRTRFIDRHTLEVDATGALGAEVPAELARSIRAAYYFLGALLTRHRSASVPMPGGDDLGPRPIDQHLKVFSALGCDWDVEYGIVNLVTRRGLKGARVFFDVVSVGATINAMLAAVKTPGQTTLENAAKEPHIVDVANFLNSMGADIRGAGTDVIKIRGVGALRGAVYSIVPDQIEAGTFMAAAAATEGDVLITGVIPKHLESVTDKIRLSGAAVEEYDEAVRVKGTKGITPTNIKTMPHPGFPTDMQPPMAALLSRAGGTSIITEGIWDSRFKYVDELRRLGAKVQVDGKIAVVEGVDRLTGAPVKAPDIRAGAALVIAALAAEGVSEIEDVYHIERGYEDVVEKFRGLGADIERVFVPDDALQQAF